MSKAEILIGTWKPDWARWKTVEPLNPVLGLVFQMMMSELTVTVDESSFTIRGRGSENPQTFSYVVRDEIDDEMTLDVHLEGRGDGVYVIKISDDDHIVMRLTEPKNDLMALQRG